MTQTSLEQSAAGPLLAAALIAWMACGACAGATSAPTDAADTAALDTDAGPGAGTDLTRDPTADDTGGDTADASPVDTAGDGAGAVGAEDYANWMSALLRAHPERDLTLLDLSMPRAHDAGTYELTSCSLGAVACNTQTQELDMTTMLEAGVRGFDLRPMLFDGDYFAHHTTQCGGLGCRGDSIRHFARQTGDFLRSHAELVILEVSHLCDTSAQDEDLVAVLAEELGDTLYTEDHTVDDAPFIQRPLRDILGLGPGLEGTTGKAVLLWDGVTDSPEHRAAGLFPHALIPRHGGWSNKQHVEDLVPDQLARYAGFDHDGSALFEFSWTLTMDAELAVGCLAEDVAEEPRSIKSMAAEVNALLAENLDALVATGDIAKGRIPQVISIDYAGTWVTDQCLRLSRLNLE